METLAVDAIRNDSRPRIIRAQPDRTRSKILAASRHPARFPERGVRCEPGKRMTFGDEHV
jgi:hypothetical protein